MDNRFYVVGDHDVWMIKFEDGEYGPYTNRDEAMAFAIDAARKLNMQGECAHVCVLEDDGRLRSIWRYDGEHRLHRGAGWPDGRAVADETRPLFSFPALESGNVRARSRQELGL
jgi:hypothetical protein